MTTENSNYKIIIIDSDNAIYPNGDSNLDFYIKLSDNIKDVYKIKILYDAVSIPTVNIKNTNIITNLDNIYINLNDYDRVKSNIKDNLNNSITVNYFDSIMIDYNKIKSTTDITLTTMYNDFNENEGDYYLYPIESNFNRIYIRLLDKKNILLTKSYLSRFVMKLCVYYYTKKISQF